MESSICFRADDVDRTRDLLITKSFSLSWKSEKGILFPYAISKDEPSRKVNHGDSVSIGGFRGVVDLLHSVAGLQLGVLIRIDSADGLGSSVLFPLKTGMMFEF